MGLVKEHLEKLLEYKKYSVFESDILEDLEDLNPSQLLLFRKLYFELPETGRQLIRKAFEKKRHEKLYILPESKLRDDKFDLIEQIRNARSVKRNFLIVCPTGWGKTTFAEGLIHKIQKNRQKTRTLFLVSKNTTLLEQTAGRFLYPDLVCLYSGSEPWERQNVDNAGVVIASLQSCIKKEGGALNIKNGELHPDRFDLIIIDEIHNFIHNLGEAYLGFAKNATIIGMSATPFQGTKGNEKYVSNIKINGERVGKPFCHVALVDEIDKGHLCTIDYCRFEPRPKEKISVKLDIEGELTFDASENRKRSEAAVDLYCNPDEMKYYKKKAIFFCVDKRHALETLQILKPRGINAECIISGDEGSAFSIHETSQRLRIGELNAITCVNRLNEGFDLPEIEVLFMLRPTRSARLYLQQIGRGLRLSQGKNTLIVVDIVENYECNGERITALDLVETLRSVEGHLPSFQQKMSKAINVSERKNYGKTKQPDLITHTAKLIGHILIGKSQEPASSEVDLDKLDPRRKPVKMAECGIIIGQLPKSKKDEIIILTDSGTILTAKSVDGKNIQPLSVCSLSKEKRNIITKIVNRIKFNQLSDELKDSIRYIVLHSYLDFVKLYEPYWIYVLNKDNLRTFGFSAQTRTKIFFERERKPFSSLNDFKARTGQRIDDRIRQLVLNEIEGTPQHYLLVRPSL